MEWWTHLWLNEGWATWMENYAVNAFFPEFKMWEQFGSRTQQHSRSMQFPQSNPAAWSFRSRRLTVSFCCSVCAFCFGSVQRFEHVVRSRLASQLTPDRRSEAHATIVCI